MKNWSSIQMLISSLLGRLHHPNKALVLGPKCLYVYLLQRTKEHQICDTYHYCWTRVIQPWDMLSSLKLSPLIRVGTNSMTTNAFSVATHTYYVAYSVRLPPPFNIVSVHCHQTLHPLQLMQLCFEVVFVF